MADVWFRKFGFSRNPFTIKPAAFSFDIIGSSIDGVLSGIDEGKVLFVEAPLGYGKTTLLKSIINRYGGRKKVVYAHALNAENLDVKGLLKRSSISNFITGSLPKGMILVVDESQNIKEAGVAELAEFYQSGNIRAVVFFGTKYSQDSFARLGMNGNVIRLSKPTPEQAISIIRGRIGNLSILSNDDIFLAYRKAQGSPRRLLQICEDMCRKAAIGESSIQPAASELKLAAAEQELSLSSEAFDEKVEIPAEIEASVALAKPKPKAARKRAKARPVQVPRINLEAKPRPKASRRKAVVQKSSLPALKARPSSKPAKKTSAPSASPDKNTEEGSYWGEFMGMQK